MKAKLGSALLALLVAVAVAAHPQGVVAQAVEDATEEVHSQRAAEQTGEGEADTVHPHGAVGKSAESATIEGSGWSKFWDYALCGASIVVASGTATWVMAGLVCGRALTEHWMR